MCRENLFLPALTTGAAKIAIGTSLTVILELAVECVMGNDSSRETEVSGSAMGPALMQMKAYAQN